MSVNQTTTAANSDVPTTEDYRALLSISQRLRYSFVPGSIYRYFRSKRMLRRGETELKMLPFLTDSEKASVDIGANKGTYTCHLATLTKHVYAYEPNPAMRQFLTRIIPENVSISDRAISDETGEAILNIPRRAKGYSNNIGTLDGSRFDGDVQRVAVPQRPLDDEDLTNVGFIKIDVEGLELAVLRGATKTIQRERPVLLVEIIEEHTGRPVKDTIQFVENLGYRTMVAYENRLVDYAWFAEECQRLTSAGAELPEIRNYIFFPAQTMSAAA